MTPRDPAPDLPPRQQLVAELIADGLADRQIAAVMGVSWQCVRRHMERIGITWELDKSRNLRTQIARHVERRLMRSAG